jgi:hypothetical protein
VPATVIVADRREEPRPALDFFPDVYKVFTNTQRLNVCIRFSLEINGDWKGKPWKLGGLLLSKRDFTGMV